MTSELHHNARGTHRRGFGDLRAHIGHGHARTAARQQLGRRDAASRRPCDGDALAVHVKAHFHLHRSFSVARLNNAKMIATITNREMTFGSLHPMSSKW